MTESLSRRQRKMQIDAYISEQRELGAQPDVIAAAINERWPGARMTPRGVKVSGWTYSIAWDGPTTRRKPVVKGFCQYKFLSGGKLCECGAEGYPYCANHRSHIASAHPGSRYPQQQRMF